MEEQQDGLWTCSICSSWNYMFLDKCFACNQKKGTKVCTTCSRVVLGICDCRTLADSKNPEEPYFDRFDIMDSPTEDVPSGLDEITNMTEHVHLMENEGDSSKVSDPKWTLDRIDSSPIDLGKPNSENGDMLNSSMDESDSESESELGLFSPPDTSDDEM